MVNSGSTAGYKYLDVEKKCERINGMASDLAVSIKALNLKDIESFKLSIYDKEMAESACKNNDIITVVEGMADDKNKDLLKKLQWIIDNKANAKKKCVSHLKSKCNSK